MKLEEFTELQKRVSRLQRDADKAAGVLEELTRELKLEFDCDSIDEAKQLLAKLKAREEKAETKFDKMLADFQKEYGDLLA